MSCCRRPKPLTISSAPYEGAGCLFTNGTHVLAGYQPNKKVPLITGLGGKRLPSETNPLDTALRETIEELFHVSNIHQSTIEDIKSTAYPKKTFMNGSYHVFVYSFVDLECMFYILRLNHQDTTVYRTLPKTMNDLIFKREASQYPDAEIRHLCLIPAECTTICKLFMKDLQLLCA